MSKRLLFVTGTRADFGKLEPLSSYAANEGFDITYFITGMHMLKRYGETRLEVRKLPYAKFFEYVNQREGDSLDLVLSKTVIGFSDFLNEHRPDLVIIHGDRVEALAASIVCAMQYVRSAHIEGGELSGTIDESIRHCNSKLCATHFVSSEEAKNRLISLGESPNRIFAIGSPELDVHKIKNHVSLAEVKSRYEINFDEYGIVVFHPVTSEIDTIGRQSEILFSSLVKTNKNFIVILPNNDPGSADIFKTIYSLPSSRFKVIPSMRFLYFSELMRNAKLMIGNSSAGVREAPFFGIPSIDIGSRQNKRGRSSSIKNCMADNVDEISRLINLEWGKFYDQSFYFGSGNASKEFVTVLNSEDFWKISLQKEFECGS